MDRVAEIKSRHEGELMKLPGVSGVAVGPSRRRDPTGHHRLVIKIFVSDPRASPQVPADVEGVPIEVEETGPFDAH